MRKAAILAASLLTLATHPAPAQERAQNAILVHGAVMDGSGWRAVHDRLVEKGMRVTVVTLPLTSLEDDVDAVRRAIDRHEGGTVLVGSSYGGAVISVAGTDRKVEALVYVAALQPDTGESVAELNARWPMEAHPVDLGNGTMIVDPEHFRADIAADLPEDETRFLAASQRPTSFKVYTTKLPEVAWREKPSFGIVATQDRTLDPAMIRFMYERSGAEVVELESAHLPHMSHPDAVAEVILKAAKAR